MSHVLDPCNDQFYECTYKVVPPRFTQQTLRSKPYVRFSRQRAQGPDYSASNRKPAASRQKVERRWREGFLAGCSSGVAKGKGPAGDAEGARPHMRALLAMEATGARADQTSAGCRGKLLEDKNKRDGG